MVMVIVTVTCVISFYTSLFEKDSSFGYYTLTSSSGIGSVPITFSMYVVVSGWWFWLICYCCKDVYGFEEWISFVVQSEIEKDVVIVDSFTLFFYKGLIRWMFRGIFFNKFLGEPMILY